MGKRPRQHRHGTLEAHRPSPDTEQGLASAREAIERRAMTGEMRNLAQLRAEAELVREQARAGVPGAGAAPIAAPAASSEPGPMAPLLRSLSRQRPAPPAGPVGETQAQREARLGLAAQLAADRRRLLAELEAGGVTTSPTPTSTSLVVPEEGADG